MARAPVAVLAIVGALTAVNAVAAPSAQRLLAAESCPVTAPTLAQAPPEPDTDPVRGYFHISDDRKLWVPGSAPGEQSTGIGRYFVRPRDVRLTLTARRLDGQAPDVREVERDGYPAGFYFGAFGMPTDGCWEVRVTAGESQVRFVTQIRYSLAAFAARPMTQVTWSREIGRLETSEGRVIVRAIVLEDPGTPTRRLRGARIELSQGPTDRDVLLEEYARLEGTRPGLERWARGQLPMIYGLGRTHNVRGFDSSFTIAGQGRTYSFPGRQPAEFAKLLIDAGDALRPRE